MTTPPAVRRNRHRKLRLEKLLHSALLCRVAIHFVPEHERDATAARDIQFVGRILAKMGPKAVAAMPDDLKDELYRHPWREIRVVAILAVTALAPAITPTSDDGAGPDSRVSDTPPPGLSA